MPSERLFSILCALALGSEALSGQPFTELVKWIHERAGLSEMDAYELLSKTAEIHLDEMVDPNYVIVAKINKKYLNGAAARR